MEEKSNQIEQTENLGQMKMGEEMSSFTNIGTEAVGRSVNNVGWWKSNKTLRGVVIAGVSLVVAAASYFFANKIQQKPIVDRGKETNIIVSPTSTPEATGGAVVVPTVSDDTSLETIEKEIESLQVEGLDQGDPSIESELQNL